MEKIHYGSDQQGWKRSPIWLCQWIQPLLIIYSILSPLASLKAKSFSFIISSWLQLVLWQGFLSCSLWPTWPGYSPLSLAIKTLPLRISSQFIHFSFFNVFGPDIRCWTIKDPIVKVEQNGYRTLLVALTISIVLGTSFCCGCFCSFVFLGYTPASTLRDHFIRLEETYGVPAIKQWLSKTVIVNHCARQSPTYWSIFVSLFALSLITETELLESTSLTSLSSHT